MVSTCLLTADIELWILKFFFSDVLVIQQFVDIVFDGNETYRRVGQTTTLKEQWIRLLSFLNISSHALHRKTDVKTIEEAWEVQDKLDDFCWTFVDMFGCDAVTNYVWIWMSAILVPFFSRFGNVRMLQLQVLSSSFELKFIYNAHMVSMMIIGF